MVKRYEGNTGRVVHIEDRPPSPPPVPAVRQNRTPPAARPALPMQLERLLGGVGKLETEDLLLLLILYLLYRESGDGDWLVTLGAMLFL